MALGKAFIEVHADTKPFARELASELDKIIRASEKTVRVSARNVGKTVTDGIGDGVKKNSNQLGKTITKAVTSGFGSDLGRKFTEGIINSLDDGLSGLPAEVKVALGAALVAISPFIGAAVSGLVSAAVGAAFAGLGVLIASQFEIVQGQWTALLGELRGFFTGIGGVFVQPVINAFSIIRESIFNMEGWFKEVFAQSATFIEPLTRAVTGFIEGLLPGLLETLRNIGPVIEELAGAGRVLGMVVGEALRIISGSDDAAEGLHDVVVAFGVLILSAAVLIRSLTEIYGVLRDISLLLTGPSGWAQFFAGQAADDQAEAVRNAASANGLYKDSINALVAPTEAEAKAIADLNNQISQLGNQLLAQQNNAIAFEQGIDDLTASVKENGRSLLLTGEAGRENARILLQLANTAIKTRADTIALTGSSVAAEAAFQKQAAQIRTLAHNLGLSDTATENLIGELLRIPPPKASGVDQATLTRLRAAVAAATSLQGKLGALARIGLNIGVAHVQAHADGGVFSTPHMGVVAEAGPEAIIPLNNPRRAAEVMDEAGLSGMTSPTVNVYIGNQAIDAYIDTRVNARMAVTARSLAYGGRGI
jgi:hypothetical protein